MKIHRDNQGATFITNNIEKIKYDKVDYHFIQDKFL